MLLARYEPIRNLALCAERARLSFFCDRQNERPRYRRYGLPYLEVLKRREESLLNGSLVECEIESPLRLCQPPPRAVCERGVPLVPHSARLVAYLRAPRTLELDADTSAPQAYL